MAYAQKSQLQFVRKNTTHKCARSKFSFARQKTLQFQRLTNGNKILNVVFNDFALVSDMMIFMLNLPPLVVTGSGSIVLVVVFSSVFPLEQEAQQISLYAP